MDSGLAATLATGGMGIITMIVHKIKCIYTRENGECVGCRCGCMDKPILEDETDIEVTTVTVNNVDLLYVGKK